MSSVKQRHHLTQVDSCTTTATPAPRVVLVYLSRKRHVRQWKGRLRSDVNRAQILYRLIPRKPIVGLRDAGPASRLSYPAQRYMTIRQRPLPPYLSQSRGRTACCPRRTSIALRVAAPHGRRRPSRVSSPACRWGRSARVHQVASTALPRRIRIPSISACSPSHAP
jgi:hypothetical protein